LDDNENSQLFVEEQWNSILAREQHEINRFLRAFYSSRTGQRAPRRELLDRFRDSLLEPLEDRQIPDFVREMRDEADVYFQLYDGDWPYENSSVSEWERKRLERLLDVLKHSLSLPLLLSCYYVLDERTFSNVVQLLELFSFRYINMVGAHPGDVERIYLRYSKQIREERIFDYENFVSELRGLILANASDGIFAESIEAKLSYEKRSQRTMIRHFLTTIEDHFQWVSNNGRGRRRVDNVSSFDLRQVTIEHIYPQNPEIQSPVLNNIKHNIGNLAIWGPTDNQAASNAPFVDKIQNYSESNIRLTRELADNNQWGIDEYNLRRERLISWSLIVFNF